jgi:hypothetical protein
MNAKNDNMKSRWPANDSWAHSLVLSFALIAAQAHSQPSATKIPQAAAQAAQQPSAAASTDKQDYSAAERLMFMTPQLRSMKPPQTLQFNFRRGGTLEPEVQDQVKIALTRGEGGACCAAHVDYLSGDRQLKLPDLPDAESNPVILFFLERDIREMQRLTKGSQGHFRKQIRMAVYSGATVSNVNWTWRGKPVAAQEVLINPYLDDPNRPRFEKFASKAYRFTFSDAVPGGVLGISTRIGGAPGEAALLTEDLSLEGAQPVASK